MCSYVAFLLQFIKEVGDISEAMKLDIQPKDAYELTISSFVTYMSTLYKKIVSVMLQFFFIDVAV